MESSEKVEILRLLSEGKISATEAVELLDKMGSAPAKPTVETDEAAAPEKEPVEDFGQVEYSSPETFKIKITEDEVAVAGTNGQRPRWLKIRVSELSSGRNKVNITLPMGLVGFGLGIARRFGADFDNEGNIDEMWNLMKQGERGVVVDVEDEEDNEHVQIYLD